MVKIGTGERVWSQSFDRELTDIFAVQDEIARSAVDALRVKPARLTALVREYQPKSQEAYQQYLLATQIMRTQATFEDARSVPSGHWSKPWPWTPASRGHGRGWRPSVANVACAMTRTLRQGGVALDKARAAAVRAIELAPTLGTVTRPKAFCG